MSFKKIILKQKEPVIITPALFVPEHIQKSRLPLTAQIDYYKLAHCSEDRLARIKRVLEFDPAECYQRAGKLIDPYRRNQVGLSIERLFPDRGNKRCPCGCDKEIISPRRRWPDNICQKFCLDVYWIIYGHSGTISIYMNIIAGHNRVCMGCSEIIPYDTVHTRGHDFETDHILPVNSGGGGCWLSNYQRLCIPCHAAKSKLDGTNRAKERRFKLNGL